MSLATIAATLEAFAETVVSDAVSEGKTFITQEAEVAKEAAEATAKNGYSDFQDLVEKVGLDVTQLVTNLMNDETLSGLEKSNLAATTLVQQASQNGITIAETDVSALVKNAYEAVSAKIASLSL